MYNFFSQQGDGDGVILENVVSQRQALGSTNLSLHNLSDQLRGITISLADSGYLGLLGDIDDQRALYQCLQTIFKQQGDHQNHIRCCGRIRCSGHLLADKGVEQLIQPLPVIGVIKDMLSQSLPVKASLRGQHVGSEVLADLRQGICPWLHHLAGNLVGINDGHALFGKESGYRAFTTPYATGKPQSPVTHSISLQYHWMMVLPQSRAIQPAMQR